VNGGAAENAFFFSAFDAAGNLYVKNSSASRSTDVIIDIRGYYLWAVVKALNS
jgi:hypothetical protein